MSATCPHCKAELGSGFVTQDHLEERIRTAGKNARDDADGARKERDAMKAKADAHDGLAKANGELTAQLTRATRSVTLAARGITNPKAIRGFERAYEDHVGEEGAKAEAFESWLDGSAGEDPLLAPLLSTSAAAGTGTGGSGAASGPKDQPKGLPNPDHGAKAPPAKGGKMTSDQLRAHYSSPAYRALTPEKQREERARLMGEYPG
jgi:hypothetical protein